MNAKITKLTTLTLTLFLATNLCAMEEELAHASPSNVPEKRKREEGEAVLCHGSVSPPLTRRLQGEASTQTNTPPEEQKLEQELLRILQKREDESKQSVLGNALEENNYKEAEIILQCGIDINRPFRGGQTVLDIVANPNKKCWLVTRKKHIDFLLQNGADLFRRNNLGLSALDTLAEDRRRKAKSIRNYIKEEYYQRLLTAAAGLELIRREWPEYPKGRVAPKVIVSTILGHLLENTAQNLNKLVENFTSKETVERLLCTCTDIDTPDENGTTPLHWAVESNQTVIAALLLEKGATVNVRNNQGDTPLHNASHSFSPQVAAKLLLDNGADSNAQNKDGSTPLHFANALTIPLLLDKGAKVNIQNKKGATPLHTAAQNGRDDSISSLVAHGADISATDQNGCTPLDYAIYNGKKRTAKLLINQGANLYATMLHTAIRRGHTQAIETLLELGANLHAQNKNGSTPLHIAALHGNSDIAKILLDKGANIDALDQRGTPLHCAVENQHDKTIRLLITRGAKTVTQLPNGRYCLSVVWKPNDTELELDNRAHSAHSPIQSWAYEKL